ncbi:hypothetical protein IAT40_007926 [Kwoniella sp. CBS 6097]
MGLAEEMGLPVLAERTAYAALRRDEDVQDSVTVSSIFSEGTVGSKMRSLQQHRRDPSEQSFTTSTTSTTSTAFTLDSTPTSVSTFSDRTATATATATNTDTITGTGTNVPIDWWSVIPLFLLRAADSMTYAVIFPFITEYITSLGTPQNRIGLYAGMAEGSLMLTEACFAPFWARMADKYGRKRCAIWGFGAVVGSATVTGFGKSVWWIIFWRAAFGLNPSGVLSRIMITECSHQSNRPFIFSLWSPVFNVGYVSGQLLGGFLANPYGRLPGFLGGQSEIWKNWPYGLPCVVVCGFGVVTIIICQIMVRDVPPPAHHIGDTLGRSITALKNEDKFRATLRIPYFASSLMVYCAFQTAVYAHSGLLTVMTYTPVNLGGWGFSVSAIGVLSSCATTVYIFSTPLILPPMIRRFPLRTTFRISLSALPLESLLIPISQAATQLCGAATVWFWLVMLLELPLYNLHMFAWPLNDNLNTDCFDNYQELVATGSAITQVAGAFGRALGPVISGWIFSHSTQFEAGSLGRQISWISLFFITLPPLLMSGLLPKTTEDLNSGTRLAKDEEMMLLEENRPFLGIAEEGSETDQRPQKHTGS